jgi:hypothetical protein
MIRKIIFPNLEFSIIEKLANIIEKLANIIEKVGQFE